MEQNRRPFSRQCIRLGLDIFIWSEMRGDQSCKSISRTLSCSHAVPKQSVLLNHWFMIYFTNIVHSTSDTFEFRVYSNRTYICTANDEEITPTFPPDNFSNQLSYLIREYLIVHNLYNHHKDIIFLTYLYFILKKPMFKTMLFLF